MSLEVQVHSLKSQIQDLTEVEYGDFKRKVGQYINRFEHQNEGQISTDLRSKLIKIKLYAIYESNGDIDSTRSKILMDLKN